MAENVGYPFKLVESRKSKPDKKHFVLISKVPEEDRCFEFAKRLAKNPKAGAYEYWRCNGCQLIANKTQGAKPSVGSIKLALTAPGCYEGARLKDDPQHPSIPHICQYSTSQFIHMYICT